MYKMTSFYKLLKNFIFGKTSKMEKIVESSEKDFGKSISVQKVDEANNYFKGGYVNKSDYLNSQKPIPYSSNIFVI